MPICVSSDLVGLTAFCFVVKVGSKRRRTKEEMREFREHEANREQHEAELQQQMAEIQSQIRVITQQAAEFKGAHDFVQQMINEGEIELDDEGNVIPLSSKKKC